MLTAGTETRYATSGNRRALIFDFDGVLVDTEPLNFTSWNLAFGEICGLQIAGTHAQITGLSLEAIYQYWLDAPQSPVALTDDLKQRLLIRKNEHFFRLAEGQLTPMPGSLELIQQAQAHGWYVAIASRALRLRLLKTLQVMHMPALFDVVLGSEDSVDPITGRKNHARAAQIFGIAPQDSIVIEDSTSGIRDAVFAEIGRVIGLTTTFSRADLLQAGAHQVVDHLSEVQLGMDTPDTP